MTMTTMRRFSQLLSRLFPFLRRSPTRDSERTAPALEWVTEPGFPAKVVRVSVTHYCGYVAVPIGHPLFGVDYDAASDMADLDVHGGLTYARGCEGSEWWWFGYDCMHGGDSPKVQDRAFCVGQCESLARQLAAFAYARQIATTSTAVQ